MEKMKGGRGLGRRLAVPSGDRLGWSLASAADAAAAYTVHR